MIRNIFKSIEVLIDMYYHRKRLRTRYKRIKRYQRTGEIAVVNKIDKIGDSGNTVNDNDFRNLKLLIEKELSPILEGIEVNISGVCPGLIRVEVSYKGCTEWFKISDYMLKKELIAKILTKAKMIAYELPIRQRGLEVYESIKLNRLADEVKGFIREVYPNIEVELQKDSTGTIDKGHWLVLKCHGVSSTEYVKRNSSKRMYLDLAGEFMIKVNIEIQRKQQEEDKKKALFKKNNPLNLKVGEIYQVKHKFSSYWESVYIKRITTDGFPWRKTGMFSGILDAENYDVKTHDGKWIHNRKAWEEFKNKKVTPHHKKYDTFRLESKPIHLWDLRTYKDNGIKLKKI